MSGDFDWSLMHSFLAVMEHGSLGRAARALHSTQPTLGRRVRQLEEQLGVPLFERRGQAVVPAPLARQLAEAGQGMQEAAAAMRQLLAAHTAHAAGTLRLSASRMVSCHLLPPILARMQAQPGAPAVELVATDEISNLVQREADIAVRLLRPEQQTVVARRLGTIRFGLYGSPAYLARRGVPQRPADLSGHALIGFDSDAVMVRGMHRMGLKMERSAFSFRSDDRIVHWAAIRAGAGLGVLPTYLARDDALLQRVLPELPITPAPVWLAVHRDLRRSAHIKQAYDYLRDALVAALQEEGA